MRGVTALVCLAAAWAALLVTRAGPRDARTTSLAAFPACAIPPCPQGKDQNDADSLATVVRGLKSRCARWQGAAGWWSVNRCVAVYDGDARRVSSLSSSCSPVPQLRHALRREAPIPACDQDHVALPPGYPSLSG